MRSRHASYYLDCLRSYMYAWVVMYSWWDSVLLNMRMETVNLSSQEGKPYLTTSQEGKSYLATSQEGKPYLTTSQEGKPYLTTSQEGKPYLTTSQEGKPYLTTSQEGKLYLTTSQEGKLYLTTSQEGKPYLTTSNMITGYCLCLSVYTTHMHTYISVASLSLPSFLLPLLSPFPSSFLPTLSLPLPPSLSFSLPPSFTPPQLPAFSSPTLYRRQSTSVQMSQLSVPYPTSHKLP